MEETQAASEDVAVNATTEPSAQETIDDSATQTNESSSQFNIKELIGEDLAGKNNIAKYLDSENPVQEMAKALDHAQSQIGKPKVGVPQEGATDEERAAFFKELGVPDDADGYEFTKPENLPDELYNADDAKQWAEFFKENNLTKEQANAARERFIDMQLEAHNAANEKMNQAMKDAFGDNAKMVATEIGEALKRAIPDESLRNEIISNVTNEQLPAFALAAGHLMQHMKKEYGMSDTTTSAGSASADTKSTAELRQEARTIMASKEYSDELNPQHQAAKDKVTAIYKRVEELNKNS